MLTVLRRAAVRVAALFPPRDPFSGPGWHVSGRDWPAGDCGMSLDEVCAALDGITPQVAAASAASLLRAGGAGDA